MEQKAYQCGPAALESIFRYWERPADASKIGRGLLGRGERGILNFALAQYAKTAGFWVEIREGNLDQIRGWVREGIPPIVQLRVGPWGIPVFHFAAVRGYNDAESLLYLNAGWPETRAIRYAPFEKRWAAGGRWMLLICPPERVRWELSPLQAADLGLLLERSGKWSLAKERYEQALRAMPESEPIRFNLANVYLQLGRREEAKGLYRELIAQNPASVPYNNNLAWACLEEGRYGESVRIGEEALRKGADRRHDLLDTLGLAYCRLEDHKKGQAYLVEALEKTPPEDPRVFQEIRAHLEECAREGFVESSGG